MARNRQQTPNKPPPETPAAPEVADTSGMGLPDLAAHREQIAVERAKLAADERAAIKETAARLVEATELAERLQAREAVIARFRQEDGPEIVELMFKVVTAIPEIGFQDKRLRLTGQGAIPQLKRPKLVDMAQERKVVIIPPAKGGKGRSVTVVTYESLSKLVYAPMSG